MLKYGGMVKQGENLCLSQILSNAILFFFKKNFKKIPNILNIGTGMRLYN